jgi:hypothetical protein
MQKKVIAWKQINQLQLDEKKKKNYCNETHGWKQFNCSWMEKFIYAINFKN